MKNRKIEYELRINTILDKAQDDLDGFGESLKQAWANGTPPKHFSKELEKLRNSLGSLQEISKKPAVNSSDVTQVENDYKAFAKTLRNLAVDFKLLTTEQKKSMLSQEEQTAMTNRANAIKQYNDLLEKNIELQKKRAPLEKQQGTLSVTQQQQIQTKNAASNKLKVATEAPVPVLTKEMQQYLNNQKELSSILKDIEALERTINDKRNAGLSEEGRNDLTRAKARLEEKKRKKDNLDVTTGAEDYKKYQQDLEDYNNTIAEAQKEFDEATESLKATNEELEKVNNKLKELEIKDEKAAFTELKKTLKDLGVEVDDSVESFDDLKIAVNNLDKQALSKVDNAIEGCQQRIGNLGEAMTEVKEKTDEASDSIKEQTKQANETDAFKNRIKEFLGMAGAAQVMQSAFRSALSTIKELDATMGEMAVVTDLGVGDYWEQLGAHADSASKLGASINDVYKAETLYYQQGLKSNEVTALATETIKMATIAGLDSADATNKMTAALRGFNMEINETNAQRVSDVYSELAAITAADVDEISSAMTKTASIASSAGMEFETTAAFLSQIIETTRESAETAGTAMKTVVARFSEVKKLQGEGMLTGTDEEGEVIDVNKIQTALRTVGISMDDFFQGTEGLDSIFMKLAEKWDTLDVKTQRYIATTAAGSRQQSRFIAMMSNYARTQELVTAANTSAGASNKQFEKTMDTLEHKLNALKTAWQEFTMGILNSDLVKVGVDILTKFLETVNKATGAFKGLGGSIMKVLSIVTLFKLGQKVFSKIETPLFNFFNRVVGMGYEKGFETGKGFAAGMKAGVEAENKKEKPEEKSLEEKAEDAKNKQAEKKSLKDKAKEKTGIDKLSEARNIRKSMTAPKEGPPTKLQSWQSMLVDENGNKISADEARQKRIDNVSQAEANLAQVKANHQKNREVAEEDYLNKAIAVEDLQKKKATIQNYPLPKSNKNKKRDKAQEEKDKQIAKIDAEIEAAEKESKAAEKRMKDVEKEVDVAEEGLKKTQEELVSFDETQEEVQGKTKEYWDSAAEGAQKLGSTVTAVGVGISVFGGILSSLGLEEAGEAFSTLGTFVTFAGTAISGIGTIIPIVAKAAATAGITVQAAWWWLVAIVAAAVALVVAIVAICKAVKANSPEGKLKAAQEAADNAADAADRAAESFNNLSDSFDSLSDKYLGLEELVEGSKEWKEAVKGINEEVLELIQTYPELAKFVDNSEGYMKLDLESQEVQNVLRNYEERATNTKNVALATKAEVPKRDAAVAFEELSVRLYDHIYTDPESGAKVNNGIQAVEGSSASPGLGYTVNKEATDNLAKAIADGIISTDGKFSSDNEEYLKQLGLDPELIEEWVLAYGENIDELVEYGQGLQEIDALQVELYEAMADNALALVDTTQMSLEKQKQVFNQATTEFAELANKRAQDEFEKMDTDEKQKAKTELARQKYGADATVKGNKITYTDEEGKKKTEKLTEEQFKEQWATVKATKDMAAALEATPSRIDKVCSALNKLENGLGTAYKAFQMGEGEANRGQAKQMDIAAETQEFKDTMSQVWLDLSEDEKAAYKDEADFIEEMGKEAKKANVQFDKYQTTIKGYNSELLDLNDKFNIDAAKKYSELLGDLNSKFGADTESLKQFDADINAMAAGLSAEDFNTFIMQLSSINMHDLGDWKGLEESLKAAGLSGLVASDSFQNFANRAKEAANAIEIVDFEKLQEGLQGVIDTINGIRSGEQKRNFTEEQYNQLLEANPNIAKDFVQVGDSFKYLGTSLASLGALLEQDTIRKLEASTNLIKNQANVSAIVKSMGEDTVKTLESGSLNDKEQKANFLEEFVKTAAIQTFEYDKEGNIVGTKEGQSEDLLASILGADGKSLGMDWGTVFDKASEEQLDEYIATIAEYTGKTEEEWRKLTEEAARSQKIASYSIQEASENYRLLSGFNEDGMEISEEDKKTAEEDRDEIARAFLSQAADSGVVAEAVLSKYAQLLEKRENPENELTQDEIDKIAELEKSMNSSMKVVIKNQEAAQAKEDLISRVTEALYNQKQKEIDKLSQINDSVNNTNQALLNKIQEQINDERQAREQEKMAENIANQEAQLAYLQRDTSGANTMAALDLNKNIEESKEQYTDSLIDQGLQKLSDDNERAAEQRQKQIDLMQASLDYDHDTNALRQEAEEMVDESLEQVKKGTNPLETGVGKLLKDTENLTPTGENALAEQFIDAANGENSPVNNLDTEITATKSNTEATTTAAKAIQAVLEKEYGKFDATTQTYDTTNSASAARETARNTALADAKKLASGSQITKTSLSNDSKIKELYKTYRDNEGVLSEAEFINQAYAAGAKQYKVIPQEDIKVSGLSKNDEGGNFDLTIADTEYKKVETQVKQTNQDYLTEVYTYNNGGNGPTKGSMMYSNGTPYIFSAKNGYWFSVAPEEDSNEKKMKENKTAFAGLRAQLSKYKTGGLADFTGPAWLDGTKSRPEMVLNARDTQNFIQLKDILSDLMSRTSGTTTNNSQGDNYYDIEINVDSIANDYDVEKMADKIRQMIYEDSMYRNVNAVNLIR